MNEIVSYCLSYCLLSKSRYTLNAKRKVVIPDVNNETSCVRRFQNSNTISQLLVTTELKISKERQFCPMSRFTPDDPILDS